MLTLEEIKYLQEELATAKNPLFFYDDDPDGVCSFILLYKIHRKGKGIIVKSAPKVDSKFLRKVNEINPDKIFILDLPLVEPEFIEQVKKPIFWLDHHQPVDVKKFNQMTEVQIKYYNPRIKNPEVYLPTTYLTYQINQNSERKKEDLWLAAVGCLADWHSPNFIDEFIAKYPQLLPEKVSLAQATFQYPVGKLIKLFSFLLKGPQSEVNKCVKILTRIKSPDELLKQETAQGKFLYKRFVMINKKYEELLDEARKKVNPGKLLLFYYPEGKWSFTSDLANELSSAYSKKVIIIGRKKSGEMKCSLRAKLPIDKVLERALIGINGYGGGHPQACGAVIKEEDWEKFLERFKEEMNKKSLS